LTCTGPSQGLDPLRFDFCDGPCEKAGGLHHLRGDNPCRRFFEQGGAGEDQDFSSSRCLVQVLFFFQSDVGEETAEHASVDSGVVKFLLLLLKADFLLFQDFRDLLVGVNPFPHAGIGEKILFAKLSHFVLCLQSVPLAMVPVPDVEEGEEVESGSLKGL